jgi:hypothetical protein
MATKRKPTVEEVMSKLKPANTIKEMLDLFIKLSKYPSYYSSSVGKNPRTTAQYRDGLVIGLNYKGDILVTKALEKKLGKDQVFEYKGKFYSTTIWNDDRENYRGINVDMVKPVKIK